MDSPKNAHNDVNSDTKKNNRTKAEIRAELDKTKIQLEKTKGEVNECYEKLKNTQSELENLQKLRENNGTIVAEVDQLAHELKEKTSSMDKLKLEIAELKSVNCRIQEEKEKLEDALEELAKKNEDAENKLKATELDSTVEDIKSPKSTFRINMYKRKNEVQGRIDHPLSKDWTVFTGVDKDEIRKFILKHPPQEETPHAHTSAKLRIADAENLPASVSIQNRYVSMYQPFKIRVRMDLSGLPIKDEMPLTYHFSTVAKPMQGGRTLKVSETQKEINSAGLFSVEAIGQGLSKGTYRLETVITSKRHTGEPAPYNSFVNAGLLYVQ